MKQQTEYDTKLRYIYERFKHSKNLLRRSGDEIRSLFHSARYFQIAKLNCSCVSCVRPSVWMMPMSDGVEELLRENGVQVTAQRLAIKHQ